MKIRLLLISAAVFLIVANSCQNQTQQSKTEPSEKELRIISLVPSLTEEIIHLGLEDNIVGATSYCEITKDNKALVVGSVIDINEEKILMLKPDIVFASTLVKEKSINILKQNGIKVVYMGKLDSFETLCTQLIFIGEQLGRVPKAKQIIKESKTKIDSLKALIPNREKKLQVFYQIGANPIAAVIPNTYMNDFITFSNCQNIFDDLENILVTRESVLLRNPDVIIISSMGVLDAQEIGIWKTYPDISAIKNNRIIITPTASIPTVNNFVENYELIIKALY